MLTPCPFHSRRQYVPTFLDDVSRQFGDPTAPGSDGEAKRLLVVCKVGLRSGAACRELEGAGWEVENLEGGVDFWLAQGKEVVWGGRGDEDDLMI